MRKSKGFKRQKIDAAKAYQRGERKEAYDLWKKAAKGRKELVASKKNKQQQAAG